MLNTLKSYAVEHKVPIICDQGLEFLLNTIKENHVKSVLEIGTAIGYSALQMESLGCYVDTFERNKDMINLAKKNFKLYDENHRIRLIESDALTYQSDLKTYDLIFIDAAKAQYQKFFDIYEKYLNPGGVIVCDNLAFHHLDINKVNRNTRQLLKKLEMFITYLKNHDQYDTKFYDLGDGMSISRKKII
ncbi:O-methyltransferase [Mycoplasmatota bacterium]|nr:O-methyltransferase [Mycoplasmatota bacterium]